MWPAKIKPGKCKHLVCNIPATGQVLGSVITLRIQTTSSTLDNNSCHYYTLFSQLLPFLGRFPRHSLAVTKFLNSFLKCYHLKMLQKWKHAFKTEWEWRKNDKNTLRDPWENTKPFNIYGTGIRQEERGRSGSKKNSWRTMVPKDLQNLIKKNAFRCKVP